MSASRVRPAPAAPLSYCLAAVAAALVATFATDARAIVLGSSSSLGSHTVQIVDRAGRLQCTGVVIDRHVIVTAAHCVSRGTVIAGGQRIAIAGVARAVVTGTGRVSVHGDAAFVRTKEPLPFSVAPMPVGGGAGERLTIAGYGAADEGNPGGGALREASVVRVRPGTLVDPNRNGKLGASACFGDSGGPVASGGALVGVITRASYPGARIACGFYTHYAPVVAR